jgi:hypothetical protein
MVPPIARLAAAHATLNDPRLKEPKLVGTPEMAAAD